MTKNLLFKRNFVITIGDYGSVVTLHNSKAIEHSLFIEKLDEENKKNIAQLFSAYKNAPIYCLLDTLDQSYKKKTYPFVKKHDLIHLIKRDIESDADKESLKNYIILDSQKYNKNTPISQKKWECLFVSSSNSQTVNDWLEFILEAPNHMLGIYMLPVETFALFNLLKNNIDSRSKISDKKNSDLYCVLLQNKASQIRQTVFSRHGIIFTRVVNYNFLEDDFLEKYEQDIHSTFEYLKRLFPDLQISEINIVNIFSSEVLAKIEKISNIDFNFVNYTPFQAASECGYNNLIKNNENFCDLLIAKIFVNSKKKILKFTTAKILSLQKLFLILRGSYYLNLVFLIMIGSFCLFAINQQNIIEEDKSIAEIDQLNASQNLARIRNSTLDGEILTEANEVIDIDRILDIGKINDAVGSVGISTYDLFLNLKFIKNYGVKLDSISYSLINFNYKNPASKNNYKIDFKGVINNRSGDIEDLFKEFDGLTSETKTNFGKAKISYTELPRNIDFAKKYYNFPIDFSINASQ